MNPKSYLYGLIPLLAVIYVAIYWLITNSPLQRKFIPTDEYDLVRSWLLSVVTPLVLFAANMCFKYLFRISNIYKHVGCKVFVTVVEEFLRFCFICLLAYPQTVEQISVYPIDWHLSFQQMITYGFVYSLANLVVFLIQFSPINRDYAIFHTINSNFDRRMKLVSEVRRKSTLSNMLEIKKNLKGQYHQGEIVEIYQPDDLSRFGTRSASYSSHASDDTLFIDYGPSCFNNDMSISPTNTETSALKNVPGYTNNYHFGAGFGGGFDIDLPDGTHIGAGGGGGFDFGKDPKKPDDNNNRNHKLNSLQKYNYGSMDSLRSSASTVISHEHLNDSAELLQLGAMDPCFLSIGVPLYNVSMVFPLMWHISCLLSNLGITFIYSLFFLKFSFRSFTSPLIDWLKGTNFFVASSIVILPCLVLQMLKQCLWFTSSRRNYKIVGLLDFGLSLFVFVVGSILVLL